jgi:hypothetical protein
MPQRLLDPENEHDEVWTGSAYSCDFFEYLLGLGGFESLIWEKDSRILSLGDAATELNHVKSSIRAWLESVYGYKIMSLDGKLARRIGLKRARHGGFSGVWTSVFLIIFTAFDAE